MDEQFRGGDGRAGGKKYILGHCELKVAYKTDSLHIFLRETCRGTRKKIDASCDLERTRVQGFTYDILLKRLFKFNSVLSRSAFDSKTVRFTFLSC